jgi:hypothetical protein
VINFFAANNVLKKAILILIEKIQILDFEVCKKKLNNMLDNSLIPFNTLLSWNKRKFSKQT